MSAAAQPHILTIWRGLCAHHDALVYVSGYGWCLTAAHLTHRGRR